MSLFLCHPPITRPAACGRWRRTSPTSGSSKTVFCVPCPVASDSCHDQASAWLLGITLLTGVVAKVTARVPLCASVICDVMEVELDKIGVAWRPSVRWVRTFLLKLGLSYKRAGGCLLKEPALAVKLDLQQNLQQKVLWTQHKFGIADARVINVDETSLRMIPVSGTGWSVKGEKTKQVQAGKSNITATLAVPMLQGPSFCQLIFGGKTSAVLPHGSVEHDVHLNFTESHWQSTESMFSFVQFLEKVLNPTDEQRPWILLLDCASVHTASAFRQQLHSQLPWVKSIYIPGGPSPRKASRHFAEQILLVDSLDLSARFLKPVIATWVHEVINDISSRRDIFQTAWAHILPKNPEHAASILLAAGEAHVAGSLFRSSKAGVVPETAPVDDEPAQPTLSHRHRWSRHRRRASARVRTTSSCFGAPQLVGAGAVHRAQDSVRQGLFLNSAHHTMSRRCSTFQLFACHQKHVSIFLCHHKAGWRMLRASSETASVARAE